MNSRKFDPYEPSDLAEWCLTIVEFAERRDSGPDDLYRELVDFIKKQEKKSNVRELSGLTSDFLEWAGGFEISDQAELMEILKGKFGETGPAFRRPK